ncbi:hypothetical protein HDU67_005608, partial [Dinochytrium kinnereticum]
MLFYLCSRPIKEASLPDLKRMASVPNIIHVALTGLKTADIENYLISHFSDIGVSIIDKSVTS